MPTAENASIYFESGQSPSGIVRLTDSGDHTDFNSTATLWSDAVIGDTSYGPTVTPDGLITGGAVTPATSGTSNLVDIAALTVYLAGTNTSVGASADAAINRTTSGYSISSLIVNSAGALAVVDGTGATAASGHSTTRAANGGPPLIPLKAVEIAQVRLSSSAAAAITAGEIYQVPGDSQERYDSPTWEVKYSRVQNQSLGYAGVKFDDDLSLIHTGGVAKYVYASFYTPSFSQIAEATDFKPAETTHSVSSTQIYGKTKGAKSSSLGQASFSVYFSNAITDALVRLKNCKLWFRFYPDRTKTPYILTQGSLGLDRDFPAGDNIMAKATVSAENQSEEVSG